MIPENGYTGGETVMKKLLALLLALAVILPCAALFAPAAAKADSLYIIPGSDTRRLTWDELEKYQYDTLMFAFNEILARHGYRFETGSRCYNWFTQMEWYHPNMNESSKNHHHPESGPEVPRDERAVRERLPGGQRQGVRQQ